MMSLYDIGAGFGVSAPDCRRCGFRWRPRMGAFARALAAWDLYGECGFCGYRMAEEACARETVVCRTCGAIFERGSFPAWPEDDAGACPRCKRARPEPPSFGARDVQFTDHEEGIF